MTPVLLAENNQKLKTMVDNCPIIPVMTIKNLEDAVPLAKALLAGGLPVLEITLRTKAATAAIGAIVKEVSGAIVGGGTVLKTSQLHELKSLGAQFAVSPGLLENLLEEATQIGLPYLPGIVSMSELMRGLELGYQNFKFFPAESSGGIQALKAFRGPFPEVGFCPTGGINRDNFINYLALDNTMCVGGSWVAPQKLIAQKDWDGIERLARESLEELQPTEMTCNS